MQDLQEILARWRVLSSPLYQGYSKCVHPATNETAGHIKPANMSSANATIDISTLALGDVVTTGKGAKQIPLCTISGEPVIWRPKDALTVLFEPSAYNQPDATRVNLCLSVSPSVVSCLQDFDEWCVSTLAAQSSKLLGSQLSAEEVRHRFQPTLRVHEASGSQSLRLKMNLSGRAAVRIWSPLGVQVSAPQSWLQCSAQCRIRLKGFWLMAKEIGVIAECTDVQLDQAAAECPF